MTMKIKRDNYLLFYSSKEKEIKEEKDIRRFMTQEINNCIKIIFGVYLIL